MTVMLPLSAELEARLSERASVAGKGVTTFILEAVEEKLRAPETLAEILAPVHEQFRASGMSDEQLDALLESALRESRRARRQTAGA